MSFWYNKELYKTIYTTIKNEAAQLIKGYKRADIFMGDVQPIEDRTYWGNDVKSNIQLYCDEDLNVDDIIFYNDKTYVIEKKIPWDDYNLYALLEKGVKLL